MEEEEERLHSLALKSINRSTKNESFDNSIVTREQSMMSSATTQGGGSRLYNTSKNK